MGLFSPLRYWSEIAPEAVQECMRQAWERWGMPERVRVDNDLPWTSASSVPSALELWLRGLGVALKRIRPSHSQENGVVERGHGVASVWSEWEQAQNVCALNGRFQAAIWRQREGYPNLRGQTRLQA